MATKTIPWNDGTGQKLYLSTDSGDSGTTTVTVTADKSVNTVLRTKTIMLTPTGGTAVSVTIRQSSNSNVVVARDSTTDATLPSAATVIFVPNHNMGSLAAILLYNSSTGAETYVGQFKVNAGESYSIALAAGTYHLNYSGYTSNNVIRIAFNIS